MRRTFARRLKQEISQNDDICLISADLGFNLWDDIKEQYPAQFINPGAAEQLMIGMAVGMALEKKIPVCYSITPFLLYRPFEFIRNYLHHEKIPVKLVGGGRNDDYKTLGHTHWAQEDEEIVSVLDNIHTFRPENADELEEMFEEFLFSNEPCYLNLKR